MYQLPGWLPPWSEDRDTSYSRIISQTHITLTAARGVAFSQPFLVTASVFEYLPQREAASPEILGGSA